MTLDEYLKRKQKQLKYFESVFRKIEKDPETPPCNFEFEAWDEQLEILAAD